MRATLSRLNVMVVTAALHWLQLQSCAVHWMHVVLRPACTASSMRASAASWTAWMSSSDKPALQHAPRYPPHPTHCSCCQTKQGCKGSASASRHQLLSVQCCGECSRRAASLSGAVVTELTMVLLFWCRCRTAGGALHAVQAASRLSAPPTMHAQAPPGPFPPCTHCPLYRSLS